MVSQTRKVKQVAAKSSGLNPSVIEYDMLQVCEASSSVLEVSASGTVQTSKEWLVLVTRVGSATLEVSGAGTARQKL